MMCFQSPISGTITIKTGFLKNQNKNDKGLLSQGHVEISYDNLSWRRMGTFSRRTEECQIKLLKPILALRVLSSMKAPLIIRECYFEP